jgi:hypothetical protein
MQERYMMPAKIDGFIAKLRAWPEFVAAANSDPKWFDHLAAIDHGIAEVHRSAESEMIEAYDEISAAIGSLLTAPVTGGASLAVGAAAASAMTGTGGLY